MSLNFLSQGVARYAKKQGCLAKVTLAAIERVRNQGALHCKGHHVVDRMWRLVAKMLEVAIECRG